MSSPNTRAAFRPAGAEPRHSSRQCGFPTRGLQSWARRAGPAARHWPPSLTASAAWAASPPGQHNHLTATVDHKNQPGSQAQMLHPGSLLKTTLHSSNWGIIQAAKPHGYPALAVPSLPSPVTASHYRTRWPSTSRQSSSHTKISFAQQCFLSQLTSRGGVHPVWYIFVSKRYRATEKLITGLQISTSLHEPITTWLFSLQPKENKSLNHKGCFKRLNFKKTSGGKERWKLKRL